MALPDFQTLMLPLLQLLSDEKPHKTIVAIESLASFLKVTNDERQELLGGGQPVFNNRVGWA